MFLYDANSVITHTPLRLSRVWMLHTIIQFIDHQYPQLGRDGRGAGPSPHQGPRDLRRFRWRHAAGAGAHQYPQPGQVVGGVMAQEKGLGGGPRHCIAGEYHEDQRSQSKQAGTLGTTQLRMNFSHLSTRCTYDGRLHARQRSDSDEAHRLRLRFVVESS